MRPAAHPAPYPCARLGASPQPRIPHTHDSNLRRDSPTPVTALLRQPRGMAKDTSTSEIQRRFTSPNPKGPPSTTRPRPLNIILGSGLIWSDPCQSLMSASRASFGVLSVRCTSWRLRRECERPYRLLRRRDTLTFANYSGDDEDVSARENQRPMGRNLMRIHTHVGGTLLRDRFLRMRLCRLGCSSR